MLYHHHAANISTRRGHGFENPSLAHLGSRCGSLRPHDVYHHHTILGHIVVRQAILLGALQKLDDWVTQDIHGHVVGSLNILCCGSYSIGKLVTTVFNILPVSHWMHFLLLDFLRPLRNDNTWRSMFRGPQPSWRTRQSVLDLCPRRCDRFA